MGNQCRILAIIYMILGVISSIILAISLGITAEMGKYSVQFERNWVLTLAIFVGGVFTSYIVYVIMMTLADTHDTVSQILFKVGNIPTSSIGYASEEDIFLANGGWKCPDCQKLNYSYETTCRCGKSKL